MATRGGVDGQGQRWEPLQYWPYALRRRTWQGHLLTRRRQTLETATSIGVVERGCPPYPNGLVTNVHKGKVPSPSQSVARDVAQDVVSPPISVRRLDRDDGERVTYHSRSHRTARVEHETGDVDTCIGRMVPYTRPKGFKRIR